jgi:hypothetical protein
MSKSKEASLSSFLKSHVARRLSEARNSSWAWQQWRQGKRSETDLPDQIRAQAGLAAKEDAGVPQTLADAVEAYVRLVVEVQSEQNVVSARSFLSDTLVRIDVYADRLWESCNQLPALHGTPRSEAMASMRRYKTRIEAVSRELHRFRSTISRFSEKGIFADDLSRAESDLQRIDHATRSLWDEPRPAPPSLPITAEAGGDDGSPLRRAEVQAALDRATMTPSGRSPDPEIARHVEAIRTSVLDALDAGCDLDPVDPDAYAIRETAITYLPGALDLYWRLPPRFANSGVQGGKSPRQILLDQLELMEQAIARLAEAYGKRAADPLAAHGRFLADKFTASSLTIDGGPGQSPSMPVTEGRTSGA